MLSSNALLKAGWPEDVVRKYVNDLPNSKIENKSSFDIKNNIPKTIKSGTSININNISHVYNKSEILKNISLGVDGGEIFGVIGLSGVGKSTLLNIISGLTKPSHGRIKVSAKIGFSTQFPSFYDRLTVMENMVYFAKLFNVSGAGDVIKRLLDDLELSQYRNLLAKNLSGGGKKRLDIALAMINDPEVLLLDEPTADLDPISRRHIWALIKNINKTGTTIVIASHWLNEIEPICDRIAILHDGTIIDIGTADHFRERFQKRYQVKVRFESGNYSTLLSRIKAYRLEDNAFIVNLRNQTDVYTVIKLLLASNESIQYLSVDKPNLRSMFEAIVK
ncbi:ATP-binding cassette domain-containing protein [Nanoarchaeota archaeon]